MSKQVVTIEVPYGWKAVRYGSPACDEWYQTPDGNVIQATDDHPPQARYLILRRVEPKKESRWALLHKSPGHWVVGSFFEDRMYPASEATGPHRHLLRFDFENDCIVSVALESAEQPLTPSAPPKE